MSSKKSEPPDYANMRQPEGWPDLDRSILARPTKTVQTNIENFSGTAFFVAQVQAKELPGIVEQMGGVQAKN